MSSRAAVTGIGILHPLAVTIPAFWEAVCVGREAIPGENWGVLSLQDFNPDLYITGDRARRMDRASQLLTAAAVEAMRDIGGVWPGARERIGMCLSTQYGILDNLTTFLTRLFTQGPGRANPMDFPSTVVNASNGHASIETGLQGYNDTLSGWGALAEAADALELGRADAMLAAGLDESAKPQQQVFSRRLTRNRPKPLAPARDGAWLSEGAAALLLERADRARIRSARIYAWHAGSGLTYDAAGLDAADSDGRQLARAMCLALDQAGLDAKAVDGLILAAEGSPAGDAREARALADVFGHRLKDVPAYAPAGILGQTEGAAEAFGAVCACLILATGQWPPSLWYAQDPQLPELQCPKQISAFSGQTIMVINTNPRGVNQAQVFVKN